MATTGPRPRAYVPMRKWKGYGHWDQVLRISLEYLQAKMRTWETLARIHTLMLYFYLEYISVRIKYIFGVFTSLHTGIYYILIIWFLRKKVLTNKMVPMAYGCIYQKRINTVGKCSNTYALHKTTLQIWCHYLPPLSNMRRRPRALWG